MLSERDEHCLRGVHPDLAAVVRHAHDLCDGRFRLTEGCRTEARQRQLVAAGKSKTMRSRHLTGHAVDIVDSHGSYDDDLMLNFGRIMKKAAAEIGVPLEWGGDWRKTPTDKIGWDSPHFQLPWHDYPIGTSVAVAHIPASPPPALPVEGASVVESVGPVASASPKSPPKSMATSKEGNIQVANGTAGLGISAVDVQAVATKVLTKAVETGKPPGALDLALTVVSSPLFCVGFAIATASAASWYFRARKRWERGI